MAVFYNSSAVGNTSQISRGTVSNLIATNAVISGTIQSVTTGALSVTAAGANFLVSRLVFSNSNNVTFGVNTAVGIVTVTASVQTAISISVSASGTNAAISTLIFSNNPAGGIYFGLSTGAGIGTITANTTNTYTSYYRYPHMAWSTGTFSSLSDSNTANRNYIQPFNLPHPISIAYIRMPVTQTFNPQTVPATISTGGYSDNKTAYFNIYTLGTGASSSVLRLLTSVSATSLWAWSVSVSTDATNSSLHAVGHTFSYGLEGNATSFTTSYTSASLGSIVFHTSHLTGFTGNRFLDINAAISLDAGPYWVAIGGNKSLTSSGIVTNAGVISRHQVSYSNFIFTQYASGFSPMGLASTYLKLGYGISTTNVQGQTSATIALSDIRTAASNIEIPFEMRRT